jgi:hypothetical protein
MADMSLARLTTSALGTSSVPAGFLPMRIREENRNIVLLATVALVAGTVAFVVAFVGSAPPPVESQAASVAVADQTSVRVVGPPFVPNTKPRDHR